MADFNDYRASLYNIMLASAMIFFDASMQPLIMALFSEKNSTCLKGTGMCGESRNDRLDDRYLLAPENSREKIPGGWAACGGP